MTSARERTFYRGAAATHVRSKIFLGTISPHNNNLRATNNTGTRAVLDEGKHNAAEVLKLYIHEYLPLYVDNVYYTFDEAYDSGKQKGFATAVTVLNGLISQRRRRMIIGRINRYVITYPGARCGTPVHDAREQIPRVCDRKEDKKRTSRTSRRFQRRRDDPARRRRGRGPPNGSLHLVVNPPRDRRVLATSTQYT